MYKMKIYTKTGDKGKTQYYGERIYKNDPRVHVLGIIDELNAFIGCLHLDLYDNITTDMLKNIQCQLIDLGSYCSGYSEKYPTPEDLEVCIDNIDKNLPPLTHFLIPVPTRGFTAYAHVCRAVTRRLERAMVDEIDKMGDAIPYVNRLSDFFFVLSRLADKDVRVVTNENGCHKCIE
jgi:cob(I)alamin adenosyltransferase